MSAHAQTRLNLMFVRVSGAKAETVAKELDVALLRNWVQCMRTERLTGRKPEEEPFLAMGFIFISTFAFCIHN